MNFEKTIAALLCAALLTLTSSCVVRSEGMAFLRGKEQAERIETQALELAAGEQLAVEVAHGDIRVRAAQGGAARVEARFSASAEDQETAKQVLARYRLEIVREGPGLSVRAVGDPLEVDGASKRGYGASVDLTLVVPERVLLTARSASGDVAARGPLGAARLESSYGDLSAEGVRGELSLETGSGSIQLGDLECGSLEAVSSYGDITASGLKAERVRLSTSSGDVTARRVTGNLEARSSYGDLLLEEVRGDLAAETSSGDIHLSSSGQGTRRLSTNYGDIQARGCSGSLEARTASGEIAITNVVGSVRAESSYGEVKVEGRLTRVEALTHSGEVSVRAEAGSTAQEAWRLVTQYGDARLVLPGEDFGCALELSAPSGVVQVEGVPRPEGGALRKLSRTQGGGGATVTVNSTGGDVVVRFH